MARCSRHNGINPVDVLLKPSVSLDELLDIASRFDAGELSLSPEVSVLLLCMLEERATHLLGPGDEVRQLGVSLKRAQDGAVCIVFKSRRLESLDQFVELKQENRNCA